MGPGRGAPAPVVGWRPSARFDDRYHHDIWYPAPGYAAPVLPGGSLAVVWNQDRLYFHAGVWFRPWGGRFQVIVPPVGVVIPLLPPAVATIWIAGAPYYYANGVYYAAAPGGYAVVAPPPGADAAEAGQAASPGSTAPIYSPNGAGSRSAPVAAAPAPAPDPIVYPRNGQSAEQIESDQQACNRWATTQPKAMADASVFKRAVEACLDGRGYTVR